MDYSHQISREMGLKKSQVEAVAGLLEEGSTIWFIARYRKEHTQGLDEVAISEIQERLEGLKKLGQRKEAILKSLEERGLLVAELQAAVQGAENLTDLEDVYEAHRPKKQTRALKAREKGLGPLADKIYAQKPFDLKGEAVRAVSTEKGVDTPDQALEGARDIIAETLCQDVEIRKTMRQLFESGSMISSKVKKSKAEEGAKFRDYFDWEEPAAKAPAHRIHALLRGQNEGVLTLHVLPDQETALKRMEKMAVVHPSKTRADIREQMVLALTDGYKRLLSKSMEKERIVQLKNLADAQAITVFSKNLRQLLLAPPMGQKRVMAIDPGFRTGCKVVCLDAQGKLLAHELVYLHQADKAKSLLWHLVTQFQIQAVAVGNGTAGRETLELVEELLAQNRVTGQIDAVLTDETGASVYSASKGARDEFPDHDITVRGAVSIGRRLMDPLAELVKIDPKSIGVGQYQHDVDQTLLKTALDHVVKSCVNQVGVAVNTASKELLAQVSGLNTTIAANIVSFRNENGPFVTRKQLLKVPRLGPKAFEQAAGFLRLRDGANPLDASGIHPESYGVVEKMAKDLGKTPADLVGNPDLARTIAPERYVTETTGLPTLKDIVKELANPGLDPRQAFQVFSFDKRVQKIEDLVPGMTLPGIVTNVTAFGAFVDVGVHQDGLVHISALADRFVKDPNEVVQVRQQVQVRVVDVDIQRKRISLSMKKQGQD